MKIEIISSSIREKRESHRVALFLQKWLNNNTEANAEIIDLKAYNFPLFEERLSFQNKPHNGAVEFAKRIDNADGVIIIAPEYNGSFPAALKNVIDLLYNEWQRKPVVLAPISVGDMAGAQVAEQLQFVLYKIGALVTKNRFHVGNISSNFNEDGSCNNEEFFSKNAENFWNDLAWFIRANENL